MVHLREVTKLYSSVGPPFAALDRISLDIGEGEFVSVTGPSGCGKSTLLNLLGGLDRPDSGEIVVGGLELHRAGEKELTDYRRRHLGVVFQFFNLLPTMSVIENVELPLLLQGERAGTSRERARETLALVGLEGRDGHFPHQLSGGEMQRAAIARALVHRPDLLLADEPTGNLDTGNAERVTETLLKIASQKIATMVVVTHSESVANLAGHRIRMLDGKILQDTD